MLSFPTLSHAFPQFSDQSLQDEIAKSGKEYNFSAGELVIDAGMRVPFVPLIIEGVLRIIRRDEEDNEIFLYYLLPGQTCATSLTCCMSNQVSEVEAIAEEDTRLIGIPVDLVNTWFEKYSEWKAFVMRTYNFRFNELLETINDIAFTQLDQRLIKYLEEKSTLRKSKIIHISHLEIAQNLNSSREVISRLLKQLEKTGRVKLGRNMIELLD